MTSPVFRTTTYRLADTEFGGTVGKIHLRHTLSANYYAMVFTGVDDTSSAPPSNYGARVTGDPYGTGDLTQVDGNWLEITRGASTDGDLVGTVVVVECLRAEGSAGFTLLSVEGVAHGDHASTGTQTGTDTSATAWADESRVVLFAGPGGGGTSSTVATSTADPPTLGIRWFPSSTATINWERYGYSTTTTEAADSTAYVVQWGSEWDVQRVNIAGSGGGDYSNSGNYTTGALARSITVAESMVWWSGWVDGDGSGDTWRALAVVPGSGGSADPGASESTLAATVGSAAAWSLDAYVMSHPSLAAAWQYQSLGDGSSASKGFTVSAPAGAETLTASDGGLFVESCEGSRGGLFGGGFSSSSSTYMTELAWHVQFTASTTATVYRGDPSPFLAWAGWLHTFDLAGVSTDSGKEPVFRVTTYQLDSGSTGTATASIDVELLYDLKANYFTMIFGADSASNDPDINFVRLSADPFATGDLTASGAANLITLYRPAGSVYWAGTVVVVECLRDFDGAGFRLIDQMNAEFVDYGIAGTQDVTFTANAEWTDVSRVTPLGGMRGGGVEVGASVFGDEQGGAAFFSVHGDDQIQGTRYSSVTYHLERGDFTVSVVQWGKEWTVGSVFVNGVTPGGGAALSSQYDTFPLDADVETATTFMLAQIVSYNLGGDDGPMSFAVVLGNGESPPATASTIAIATQTATDFKGMIWLLSHPSIAVDHVYGYANGLTSTKAVAAPVRGESYGETGLAMDYTSGYRFGIDYGTGTIANDRIAAKWWPRHTDSTTLTLTRILNTDYVDGWSQSVDLGGVQTLTDGSGWEDDVGTFGPVQGMIFRDRWMDSTVITATSEGSPLPGPVVPASTNDGALFGFQEGTPDPEDAAWPATGAKTFDYLVTKGGGLDQFGGFARKRTGDTSAAWAGTNAYTNLFRQCSPIAGSIDQSCAVYSSAFNRMIAMKASGSFLSIYYAPTGTQYMDEDAWSFTSATIYNAGSDTFGQESGMDCVELPDGRLLMAMTTDEQGYRGIDIYMSGDGGLTWERTNTRLLRAMEDGAGSSSPFDLKLAVSGDYVRLGYMLDDPDQSSGSNSSTMRWYVSPDRGGSWRKLGTDVPLLPVGGSGGSVNYGQWPVAVTGMGDPSGTMVLAVCNDASLDIYIAAGLNEWVHYTGLDIDYGSVSVGYPYACWLVRDPDRLWLIALVSDNSTAGELHATVVDPADLTDADSWVEWGTLVEYDGLPDHTPYNTKGIWGGDCIMLFGQLCDVSDLITDNAEDGSLLMVGGQWDRMPWNTGDYPDVNNSGSWVGGARVNEKAWHAWMNEPQNATGNVWLQATDGGSDTYDDGRAVVQNVSSTNYRYFWFDDGAVAAAFRWGAISGACHYVSQVTSSRTTIDITTTEHMGARFLSYGGTLSVDFTIREDQNGFVIVDNQTSGVVYNHDGGYSTASPIVEWRVNFVSSSAVQIHWREVSGIMADGAWNTTGSLTLTNFTSGGQSARFGVLQSAGTSGTSSYAFREFVESYYFSAGQDVINSTLPDNMMGNPLTSGGVHVGSGVSVKWGGSSGVEGDEYTGDVAYTRGVDNLLLDSPQLMWESYDSSEASIVFQAGATYSMPRWQVDALMLIGTVDRTCALEFSNTDDAASWATPAFSVVLSSDLYTGLTVVQVDGSCLKLQAAPGESLPPLGEVTKMFLRVTNAGVYSGHTYTVKQDHERGDGWFQVDCEASVAFISPGSSVVLYGDRMAVKTSAFQRYRYFRLVFPDVVGQYPILDKDGLRDAGTPTGTHRLGAVVPGFWQEFDVPIDWTHTNNEQPNSTEGRTKSGVSWVNTEGPPARTVTGRIVGDVDEFRRLLRRVLSKWSDYNRVPAGFILNGKNLNPDNAMLVRWQSGSQQDEAAWYLDDNGHWRTAGDIDLVLVEVT